MLLSEATSQSRPVRVLCTQPRRLAALMIAERVAHERGEKLGHTVGYQIRLESKWVHQFSLLPLASSAMSSDVAVPRPIQSIWLILMHDNITTHLYRYIE